MCGGRERPPYGKIENIETNQENTAMQGPAGGPWPSPTNHGEHPANRCGLDHPGDRRAGYPHPAGPCGGGNACGRDKSLPYKPRRARGQPENQKLCFITNLCRGRCLHRPEGPRTAARSRGRAMALPYKLWKMPRQTGAAATTRATVGRDALIPPDPAAAGTFAG